MGMLDPAIPGKCPKWIHTGRFEMHRCNRPLANDELCQLHINADIKRKKLYSEKEAKYKAAIEKAKRECPRCGAFKEHWRKP